MNTLKISDLKIGDVVETTEALILAEFAITGSSFVALLARNNLLDSPLTIKHLGRGHGAHGGESDNDITFEEHDLLVMHACSVQLVKGATA